MGEDTDTLDDLLLTESTPQRARAASADTCANVALPFIFGTIPDYLAGLTLVGSAVARVSSIPLNLFTGGMYGYVREKVFQKTGITQNHTFVQKSLANIIAFNLFQTPLYVGVTAWGSYASTGNVDPQVIGNASMLMAGLSLFIGPFLGMTMDKARDYAGVNRAGQTQYNHFSSDSETV